MTTERPARHRAVLTALVVGLVLTVVAAVYPFVDRATTHLLADHIRAGYPAYPRARIDTAVTTYLTLLAVSGALGALAWLATIGAVKAGKRWARTTATAMFVLGLGTGLTALLTKDTSGQTGLAPALGWIGMAPCLAGLVAVTLLWTRRRPARRTFADGR
ncbi:hypothetical protein [Actinomadura verrucosospora]|uniref:Uncharacterized protein n=1 Tax=Actinomadura verrucosospora TaxID=46165 RepID=A0A7D3VUY4_ACTVE|nr:hypothetical protein [Actinomadura verrucosospora]QKG23633.1 hypothetical protein ACTIVE_5276 [Actinomadura verrucosospora]